MNMSPEYHRAWRAANSEKCAESQRRYKARVGVDVIALHSNHRLTLNEAREAIAAKPEACEICNRDDLKLYYDHDHATKQHRGWLCNSCNVRLSMVEDSVLLEAALLYLERCNAAV